MTRGECKGMACSWHCGAKKRRPRIHRPGHRKRRFGDRYGARGKHPRVTCLVVENTRTALADLSATFTDSPAQRLKLAAVTGTNGKTTTTFLIKHICEKAGLRCGLIGTVRYEIGERVLPAIRTTPESLDLQELLAQIVNAGCRAAAMEVSSHALAQDRTRGLEWNVAVFTNLTQDHLDFHGTMESYFDSKAKLFTQLGQSGKKAEARRSCEHRRPLWRTIARQDRQARCGCHLWNGSARGFSRFKLSRGV